jgi:hypothetical protein
MFPAADCSALAQTLPLTGNWDTLEGMVDTMTPAGNTNVIIGMMWGWRALTPNEAFTLAQTPRPTSRRSWCC